MGLLMTIDNGGTFTDACLISDDRVVRAKSLTTPYDLTECFMEVIKQISKEYYGKEDIQTLLTDIDYLRYSTTAGTNAIVEKKGSRLGLILRDGVDPKFLQDSSEKEAMYKSMVDDRVAKIDFNVPDEELEANVVIAVNELLSKGANRIVISLTNPKLIKDEIKIKNIILRKYPRHLLGAVPMLISHELVDDPDDNRRTWGALINSYLHSGMERFLYNAENTLRNYRMKNQLLIYHNDGNSARVAKTTAIKSYGSGPRGGMEGTKALANHYNIPDILTLDVGGTTSDIGVVQKGKIKEDMYGKVESIPTSFSSSDLTSVGAGGSSVFKVVDGKITVGPESVGAAPGPACFARGGKEATITDAYLLMGVLDSRSYFRGEMTLDEARAKQAIKENVADPLGVSIEKALLMMEDAYVNKIAEGFKPYKSQLDEITLLAFGGAGPMSACTVAEAANIDRIIIPRLAAIFSAFGISFSDIAHEYQVNIDELDDKMIKEKLDQLKERAERDMFAEGFELSDCSVYESINYLENESYHSIPLKDLQKEKVENLDEYRLHLKIEKPIDHYKLESESILKEKKPVEKYDKIMLQKNMQTTSVPVYDFNTMSPGDSASGPALIEDEYFTSRILPGWKFIINENKDIIVTKEGAK